MESSNERSLVQVSVDEQGVALMQLNRPEKRNALSRKLIDSIISAIAMVEKDNNVKVVVLTGSRTAGPFSAGADLSELQHISTAEAHRIQYLKDLSDAVTSMRKPIIACVAGFALGGGFELALMCDIVYAAEDAKFGLPELSVGTIPGAGGTQRLARVLGKYLSNHLILTSTTLTGSQLYSYSLVSAVFPLESLLSSTLALARKIAGRSVPVVSLAKQAVLAAEETHLKAGLDIERGLYYSSFSLEDRAEGMKAFVEKRDAVFHNQ